MGITMFIAACMSVIIGLFSVGFALIRLALILSRGTRKERRPKANPVVLKTVSRETREEWANKTPAIADFIKYQQSKGLKIEDGFFFYDSDSAQSVELTIDESPVRGVLTFKNDGKNGSYRVTSFKSLVRKEGSPVYSLRGRQVKKQANTEATAKALLQALECEKARGYSQIILTALSEKVDEGEEAKVTYSVSQALDITEESFTEKYGTKGYKKAWKKALAEFLPDNIIVQETETNGLFDVMWAVEP